MQRARSTPVLTGTTHDEDTNGRAMIVQRVPHGVERLSRSAVAPRTRTGQRSWNGKREARTESTGESARP